MHEAGMASVGKHFPGHGAVTADSHHDLPEDCRSYADLEMEDMIPFQRLSVNGMNGVMVAHVLYSQIDNQPAGFSPYWLRGVLRRTLGFQGVIFSDDLSMGGAEWAGDYPYAWQSVSRAPEITQKSTLAGGDSTNGTL
jgi:beta-N-acetylhexosaminidase